MTSVFFTPLYFHTVQICGQQKTIFFCPVRFHKQTNSQVYFFCSYFWFLVSLSLSLSLSILFSCPFLILTSSSYPQSIFYLFISFGRVLQTVALYFIPTPVIFPFYFFQLLIPPTRASEFVSFQSYFFSLKKQQQKQNIVICFSFLLCDMSVIPFDFVPFLTFDYQAVSLLSSLQLSSSSFSNFLSFFYLRLQFYVPIFSLFCFFLILLFSTII